MTSWSLFVVVIIVPSQAAACDTRKRSLVFNSISRQLTSNDSNLVFLVKKNALYFEKLLLSQRSGSILQDYKALRVKLALTHQLPNWMQIWLPGNHGGERF